MRKRYNFWLDEKREDDLQTEAIIQDLKQNRLFSRAIREGLKMWVEAQDGIEPATKPIDDDGAGDTKRILEMLELLVTNQKANGGYTMQSLQPMTGKLLTTAPLSMPAFDDDDEPMIVTKKDIHTDAGLNFIHSVIGIQ